MPRALKVVPALFVGFVVLAAAAYAALFQLDVRLRLGFAPGFALTAADGSALTSDDLRGGYTFDHTGNDDAARGTTPALRAVTAAADDRSLVREAQSAEGTLGLAYEAAHLFSCYSVASP